MTNTRNKSVLNTTKNKIIALILLIAPVVHFTGALAETGAFIIYICKNYQLPGCQLLPKTLEERQTIILDRLKKLNFEKQTFNTIINQKFHNRHPELHKSPLNSDNPQHKQLMFEWCDMAEKFLDEEEKNKK